MENKSIRVPDEKYLYAKVFYSLDCDDFKKIGYCFSNCKHVAHVIAECCVCCNLKVDCPYICAVAREELIRKGVREG